MTLKKEKKISTIQPNLRTSNLNKSIHARWLIEAHNPLSKDKDLIVQGFEKVGIKDTITTA